MSLFGKKKKDEQAELVMPVLLTHVGDSSLEADYIRGKLAAFGIPSEIRYPHEGGLGKVILGASGFGADIYVPRNALEDARALLEADDNEDESPEELDEDEE